MKSVARGDVLIAIPHDDSFRTYDVYGIRMTTGNHVVYNWLRQLYSQGKSRILLGNRPSDVVEQIISSIGEEYIDSWKVVALGISEERLFTDIEVNFPLARMLYILRGGKFDTYYPLWLDVDYDRFLLTGDGGQILTFPKNQTTTDEKEFLANFMKYTKTASKVNFDQGGINFETFIAAIIAGARCAEGGTKILVGGRRGILAETETDWVVIRYRRAPTTATVEGMFIKLPLNDASINNVYREIVRRTESIRVKSARKFADIEPEEAQNKFTTQIRNSLGPLIPEYYD